MTRSAIRSLLSLIAGLAIGVAVAAAPAPVTHAFAALEPVGTLWVNAIRMTVIPLVVSLLIATIAEESNLRAVGGLGVRAVAIFATFLAVSAFLTFLAAPPLFTALHIDAAAAASLRGAGTISGSASALPSFSEWLTSLIPSNPVKAAADGAMLPLIVFAVAFAAALARIGTAQRAAATALFRALADAMLVIVGWVLAAAPVGVFCLAVALGVRLGVGVAGAVAFYLVVHCALVAITTLLLYVVIRVFSPVPLAEFARAAAPAQVIAMSTRSSVAALPAMIDGATRVLKLPMPAAGFVLPFGVSVFRLNQGVTWIVSALFLSKLYAVPLTMGQLAFLGASSVAASFSIPGIPSGGLVISAPFFVAVGLPMEGVGILFALDAIPDVLKTLLNVTGQFTATVLLSD
ncbi:MAG TPA: cation:dicarboxylase symporter family transporter [Gemmatimonadaceae bacterium]